MLNWKTEIGQRALQRLDSEYVVWLTTVSPGGIPQPRPVWFLWYWEAFLVFSTPAAHKIEHIRANPHVSLHFDGGPHGEDVQVFSCEAHILESPVPGELVEAYLKKYRQGIRDLDMDEKSFFVEYSQALRIVPARLRGIQSSSY